jgi:hypothetical protein
MFFAEHGDLDEATQTYLRSDGKPTPFISIPHTFYWCIVTMVRLSVFSACALRRLRLTHAFFVSVQTTVGYGARARLFCRSTSCLAHAIAPNQC